MANLSDQSVVFSVFFNGVIDQGGTPPFAPSSLNVITPYTDAAIDLVRETEES